MRLSYWKSGGRVADRVYIQCPSGYGITLWAEQYGMNDYKLKYKAGQRCEKSAWTIECFIKDTEARLGHVTWSYLMQKAIVKEMI